MAAKTKTHKYTAVEITHYEVHTSSGCFYTDVKEQALRWAKRRGQSSIQVIYESRTTLHVELPAAIKRASKAKVVELKVVQATKEVEGETK